MSPKFVKRDSFRNQWIGIHQTVHCLAQVETEEKKKKIKERAVAVDLCYIQESVRPEL